jgi:WD40 repeat protein
VTALTTVGLSTRVALPTEPYPGLRPFEPNEHRIFFGREEMIDTVIDALARKNLVVVHGASGSGKSSFVRAGVLPWLAIQQSRRRHWLTEIRRPAGGPLRNLASALADLFGAAPGSSQPTDPLTSWHTRLALGRTVLDDIEALLSSKGSSLCLLIDQFEELFRYAKEKSREEAELLTQLLCSLASEENPAPHLFIILTMRSDYLGECARFDGFAETVNSCQYLLPRLDDFGLLRAIHEPAKLYGGEIDPAVGDRLLFAARRGEDALPVLQHTLMRACAHARKRHGSCEGWTVTMPDLETVEGKDGALSRHADEVLAEIQAGDPMKLKTAEWLFRSLTEFDAEGRVIRRPRNLAELIAVAGGDRAKMIAVIEAFRGTNRNFLMTDPPGPLEETTEIDISHEALIRCWQRLSDPTRESVRNEPVGWVWREFEDGQRWRALAVQARVFRNDKSATLSPATTEIYEPWWPEHTRAWAARYARDKESASDEYEEIEELWQASKKALEVERTRLQRETRAAKERAEMERQLAVAELNTRLAMEREKATEEKRERELIQARKLAEAQGKILEAQRKTNRRTLIGAIGGGVLAILAIMQAIFAETQKARVEQEKARAEQEATRADQEAKVARLQSQLARVSSINVQKNYLEGRANTNLNFYFELERDRQRARTEKTKAQAEGEAADTKQSREVLLNEVGKLGADLEGTISEIRRENERVWLSLSEADRSKITDNIVERLRSFPYKSLENKLRVALYAVAAIPEERAILNNSLRGIIEESRQRRYFRVPSASQVWGLAFTERKPGQLAAVGDDNGVVWIWDPLPGSAGAPKNLTAASGVVNGVAFNGNGTLLAAAYRNGGVAVWDLDKSDQGAFCPLRPAGENRGAYGVAFNGAFLAIASGDKAVHLWDVSQEGCPAVPGKIFRRNDLVFGVAFSPDGKLVAAASGDGTVAVWDINSPDHPLLDVPLGKPMFAVAFSPDGKTLAATGADGVGYLWNRDGKTFSLPTVLLSHDGTLGQISFSPNGQMVVATADATGTAFVTSIKMDARGLKLDGTGQGLFGVAFSPDSKYLLTGSNLLNTVRLLAIESDQLWDVTNRDELISLGVQRVAGMQLDQTECGILREMDIPIFNIINWDAKDMDLVCPFPFLGKG